MQPRKIVLTLLVVSLSGCGLGNVIKERREAKAQAYINSAQELCKQYGFVEKTDSFAQCMQNEVNAAKARDAAKGQSSTKTSCSKTINGMDCTTQ